MRSATVEGAGEPASCSPSRWEWREGSTRFPRSHHRRSGPGCHPPGHPGGVQHQDVSTAEPELLLEPGEALQVDGKVVGEEAVGEALDRSQGEAGKPALMERLPYRLELPILQEAKPSGIGNHVEGVGALRWGEGWSWEDLPTVEWAAPSYLGDGLLSVEGPYVMGPSVTDNERMMTGGAFLLRGLVPYRAEGSGVTRYAERDAGGGGC